MNFDRQSGACQTMLSSCLLYDLLFCLALENVFEFCLSFHGWLFNSFFLSFYCSVMVGSCSSIQWAGFHLFNAYNLTLRCMLQNFVSLVVPLYRSLPSISLL